MTERLTPEKGFTQRPPESDALTEQDALVADLAKLVQKGATETVANPHIQREMTKATLQSAQPSSSTQHTTNIAKLWKVAVREGSEKGVQQKSNSKMQMSSPANVYRSHRSEALMDVARSGKPLPKFSPDLRKIHPFLAVHIAYMTFMKLLEPFAQLRVDYQQALDEHTKAYSHTFPLLQIGERAPLYIWDPNHVHLEDPEAFALYFSVLKNVIERGDIDHLESYRSTVQDLEVSTESAETKEVCRHLLSAMDLRKLNLHKLQDHAKQSLELALCSQRFISSHILEEYHPTDTDKVYKISKVPEEFLSEYYPQLGVMYQLYERYVQIDSQKFSLAQTILRIAQSIPPVYQETYDRLYQSTQQEIMRMRARKIEALQNCLPSYLLKPADYAFVGVQQKAHTVTDRQAQVDFMREELKDWMSSEEEETVVKKSKKAKKPKPKAQKEKPIDFEEKKPAPVAAEKTLHSYRLDPQDTQGWKEQKQRVVRKKEYRPFNPVGFLKEPYAFRVQRWFSLQQDSPVPFRGYEGLSLLNQEKERLKHAFFATVDKLVNHPNFSYHHLFDDQTDMVIPARVHFHFEQGGVQVDEQCLAAVVYSTSQRTGRAVCHHRYIHMKTGHESVRTAANFSQFIHHLPQESLQEDTESSAEDKGRPTLESDIYVHPILGFITIKNPQMTITLFPKKPVALLDG